MKLVLVDQEDDKEAIEMEQEEAPEFLVAERRLWSRVAVNVNHTIAFYQLEQRA